MLFKDGVKVTPTAQLKGKDTVTFQLAAAYIAVVPLGNGRSKRMAPRNFLLPAEYTYIDKKDGPCMLRYAETINNSINKQGNPVKLFAPDSINFIAGVLVVKKNQPDLLEFLLNHPLNASNPDRDDTQHARFYEVDPVKAEEEEFQHRVSTFEVTELIMKTMTEQEQRTALKIYGEMNVDHLDPKIVRNRLITIATDMVMSKKDPRYGPQGFMRTIGAPTMKIKALVQDAIDRDLIKFDGKNRWIWLEGDAKGNVIVPVPSGQNHIDYFVDWMVNRDDSGVKGLLEEMVGFAQAEEKSKVKEASKPQ